jgi:FAD/FMN-containing dehydrogenase
MRLDPPAGFRGVFRADDEARAVYSEAAGIGRVLPLAVAVPRDTEDVATVLRWSNAEGLAIIPRGSGSSMAGGAIGEGIVLDLTRLKRLDDPDARDRTIRAEVGVVRGEIDRRARTAGLCFPVDPSSGEFCTIGGMVATNAAGAHSLRHGSTRPWVMALRCVFADGNVSTIERGAPPPTDVPAIARFARLHSELLAGNDGTSHPRVLKDSSGYSVATYRQTQELIDLLVGSEGTLAVFTEVRLALAPASASKTSLFVAFRDLERAVEAAVEARDHGATACELLDRTFLSIAARANAPFPVPTDTEAVLLVDIESHETPQVAATAEGLRDSFRNLGASEVIIAGLSGHDADLWSFRHAASPAIARMDPSLRSMQFIEDAAVPARALAAYVRGVRAILERNDTPGVIFGHAGDAHVHVNPLVDVRRPDWRARVERILAEVTDLVAQLDGTLTGEHGDGRLRTPLLDRVWRVEELKRFAMIKGAFDPGNRLNPGVKIPIPGQKAVDQVKYDPALRPLPPSARKALDVIEQERAYARFRLDLLSML